MSIDYVQMEMENSEPENATIENSRDEIKAVRPLPRISVHCFCDTPDLLSLMENCSTDRRLMNVSMRVNQGGVLTAARMFETTPTPNLLIIEVHGTRDQLMEELADLASVCDQETSVILIGKNNDISLYRELIRNGISEYLVKPVSMVDIVDTMSNLFTDPEAEPLGKSIAFFGAKGGVGASTIAHNIGWGISEMFQSSVILADLDLAYGTANLNFDRDPLQGVAEAIQAQGRLDDVFLERLLESCTEHMSLLVAPSMMDKTYDLDEDAFSPVMQLLQRAASVNVFDVPHVWNSWTLNLLSTVDEVVVCATPDLANLRNTKNIFDAMEQARPNDPKPHLIINQAGMPKRPEIEVDDFCGPFDIKPISIIPFNPELFGAAANSGQMIAEVDANSPTAESFSQIAHILTGRSVLKQQKSGPLAALMSRFGR